jgi:3-oxoacyl-[acyl-carrier protein] reductase
MGITLDFSGQTVLVTGSTRGIGAAIARDFLSAGAEVILTGHDRRELDAAREAREAEGFRKLRAFHVDFTDGPSLQSFLDSLSAIDRLDVCVNNAGTNRNNPIDEARIEDYDALQNVNLRAPFLVCRAVSPVMKRRGYGRIVNIASIWGVISRPRRAVYSVTKFGIVGLTKAVAADLAPHGVLVNAVSPGFTLTELTRSTVSEAEMRDLSGQVPLGRFAEPHEIAKTVLFLSSPLNTYLTGQNIVVDGGFTSV